MTRLAMTLLAASLLITGCATPPPAPPVAIAARVSSSRLRTVHPKHFATGPAREAKTRALVVQAEQALLAGAPGSKARAVALYRKAAARGDAVAQYNLGYCNEAGLGLPVDARQAAAWYRKAANNTQDPVVQRMATSSLATLGGGTAAVAASATP